MNWKLMNMMMNMTINLGKNIANKLFDINIKASVLRDLSKSLHYNIYQRIQIDFDDTFDRLINTSTYQCGMNLYGEIIED